MGLIGRIRPMSPIASSPESRNSLIPQIEAHLVAGGDGQVHLAGAVVPAGLDIERGLGAGPDGGRGEDDLTAGRRGLLAVDPNLGAVGNDERDGGRSRFGNPIAGSARI